ncbi:MAG: hypothetical protein PHO15_05485 [Eubacteriales bacterium]|nr:hypothetical protein [Eubacteriales bacterium]
MFDGYGRFGCDTWDVIVGGYGDGPCGGYISYWDRFYCCRDMCRGAGRRLYCPGCGRPYDRGRCRRGWRY